MNALLWVLQILLALAFFAHGWMFLAPSPEIAALMNASLPRWFQLFMGVAEVSAAIGLTLPGVTRILPALVPAAAFGIMIVMISATVYHIARAEYLLGRHHVRAAADGDVHRLRALAHRADSAEVGATGA